MRSPPPKAQRLGRDAADRRHRLRAVAAHVLLQRPEVVDTLMDEGGIDQALFDDGVDQRIEHGHVGVGLELQRAPGVFADVGHARVCQNYFRAAFSGVFHPRCRHGVVGGGVGTDHKNQVLMLDVIDLVTHRT